jgi:hypothetical protein
VLGFVMLLIVKRSVFRAPAAVIRQPPSLLAHAGVKRAERRLIIDNATIFAVCFTAKFEFADFALVELVAVLVLCFAFVTAPGRRGFL